MNTLRLLIILFLLGISESSLQNSQSFFDMPSSEVVFDKVRGSSIEETLIKQYATLDRLAKIAEYQMLSSQMENDLELVAAKNRLFENYKSGMSIVKNRYSNEIKALTNPINNQEFHDKVRRLSYDVEFRSNIVSTLLSETARNQFELIKSTRDEQLEDSRKSGQDIEKERAKHKLIEVLGEGIFWIVSILILISGLFLAIYAYRWRERLSKYEFENMSPGGVIQFDQFGRAQAHNRNKTFSGCLILVGIAIFLFTLAILSLTLTNRFLF